MNFAWRLVAGGLVVFAIFPCSIDTSPSFRPRRVPEKFDSAFVRGKLGIIPASLSAKYKLIAWRYLAGLPLDKDEQDAILAEPKNDLSFQAMEPWRVVRQPIAPPSAFFYPSKNSRIDQGAYYVNCLPDAFITAARTLKDRQQRYANQNLFAAWVAAQDQVFQNCTSENPVYPADPDSSLTSLARADRMYQIAAAHFYAEDLEGAALRFRAIADDNDSPWRDTAAYLVGRTLIREGSLLHKPEALALARTLLQKIGAGPLHDSAQGLIRYADSAADPESVLKSLAGRLALQHPGPDLAGTIDEAAFVLTGNRFQPLFAKPVMPEPFEWITALGSNQAAYSMQRWRESQSPLWLAAALMHADPKGDYAADLIDAGLRIPQSSPAFDTVVFHAIRLMIGNGQSDQARRKLDILLGGRRRELNSVDNAFRAQRMSLATSFDDFLRWAPRRPIGIGDSDYEDLTVDDSPVLDNDSVEAFNYFTPLPKLVAAAESNRLGQWPRTQVAIATWTRAFVLGDDDAANRMTPILARANPAWAADLEAFRTAGGAEKRFTGALLIARHGSFHTRLRSDFRPTPTFSSAAATDWWCGEDLQDRPNSDLPDAALSKADRAEAAREGDRVREAGDGQTFLAPIVMTWSKAHPDDPRVPESLHRLVRVTRYGCRGGSDNGSISKAAFDLLHKKYAASPWARQTPYWFK